MFLASTAPGLRHRLFAVPARPSLDCLFDQAHLTSRQRATAIEQDDKSFTLTFDMPGIARDQLEIGIEGGVVRVRSKDGAPRSYQVAYELPSEIDVGSSEAKLENGVLTLKLAKVAPLSKVTELPIN